MPLPLSASIEIPVLQELAATGGTDDARFLYERLTAYFPQISDAELLEIKNGEHKNWRLAVQKAAKFLDEKGCLKRKKGLWTITERGRKIALEENSGFALTVNKSEQLTHITVQQMLIEIGEVLGFYAEMEFEYYDVVWRETSKSPRISHIFEVQNKGNLDSAFAKLKRAYQNQRTKPFLIVSTESDLNRARQSLTREFHDIERAVTIFTFAQIKQVHRNLSETAEIIKEFLLI